MEENIILQNKNVDELSELLETLKIQVTDSIEEVRCQTAGFWKGSSAQSFDMKINDINFEIKRLVESLDYTIEDIKKDLKKQYNEEKE